MSKERLLAWVDIETTGSDETKDYLLEVGLVITEPGHDPESGWLAEVSAVEVVVRPEDMGWVDRLHATEVVREMHTRNGLAVEVLLSPEAMAIADAELRLIHELRQYGKPHDFMLAGSGVAHFDRRWITTHMPQLHGWFTYPVFDVGVLRRAMWLAGRDDLVPGHNDEKPHRGLADVRLHIDEARHYLSLFASHDKPLEVAS